MTYIFFLKTRTTFFQESRLEFVVRQRDEVRAKSPSKNYPFLYASWKSLINLCSSLKKKYRLSSRNYTI